jgi:hypothetical protein
MSSGEQRQHDAPKDDNSSGDESSELRKMAALVRPYMEAAWIAHTRRIESHTSERTQDVQPRPGDAPTATLLSPCETPDS